MTPMFVGDYKQKKHPIPHARAGNRITQFSFYKSIVSLAQAK